MVSALGAIKPTGTTTRLRGGNWYGDVVVSGTGLKAPGLSKDKVVEYSGIIEKRQSIATMTTSADIASATNDFRPPMVYYMQVSGRLDPMLSGSYARRAGC
jgi:hypothetical protein